MPEHILIKWRNKDARGSVDIIDFSWFEKKREIQDQQHPTMLGKEMVSSKFDLVPMDSGLLFRYGGKHAAANAKQGIFPGDMIIVPAELPNTKEKYPLDTQIAWREDSVGAQYEQLPVRILLGYPEGKRRGLWSATSTRHAQLASIKRGLARAKGKMTCEACGTTGHEAYGSAVERIFEVHHKVAISGGQRVTTIDNLALICANCHNALHGLGKIALRIFWLVSDEVLGHPSGPCLITQPLTAH
ncbi:HNH endonuclease signature motif containing protein [Labrys sp. KB_33_2]|uniref:HNH endonuclease signature motif containing protein n=1 Tax=Labrys sp. KB_33_2 TaxID=3237479 RepID=UPI003F8E9CF3